MILPLSSPFILISFHKLKLSMLSFHSLLWITVKTVTFCSSLTRCWFNFICIEMTMIRRGAGKKKRKKRRDIGARQDTYEGKKQDEGRGIKRRESCAFANIRSSFSVCSSSSLNRSTAFVHSSIPCHDLKTKSNVLICGRDNDNEWEKEWAKWQEFDERKEEEEVEGEEWSWESCERKFVKLQHLFLLLLS